MRAWLVPRVLAFGPARESRVVVDVWMSAYCFSLLAAVVLPLRIPTPNLVSFLQDGDINWERLADLREAVGKERSGYGLQQQQQQQQQCRGV